MRSLLLAPLLVASFPFKHKQANEGFLRLSESGVVVRSPDKITLFYDQAKYDGSSASVSVTGPIDIDAQLVTMHETHKDAYSRYFDGQFSTPCPNATQSHGFVDFWDCPSQGDRRGPGASLYRLRAQISSRTDEVMYETSSVLIIVKRPRSPWPLENEPGVWPPNAPNALGNIYENYQTFGGIRAPYWHQGLDIRGELLKRPALTLQDSDNSESLTRPVASAVHSPVTGKVVQKVQYGAGHLYWSLMVMDNYGFVWQFHHIDPSTMTVEIGQQILRGHVLGYIAQWPASQNGAYYHHVHMNVARPHRSWFDEDGVLHCPKPYIDGWIYYNPLDFLNHGKFRNAQRPYTDGLLFLFKHGSETAFAAAKTADMDTSNSKNATSVSGHIDAVISFSSEFDPSNSVPGYPYIHGVHELKWSLERVLDTERVAGPFVLLSMARMGPNWDTCAPSFTVACAQSFLTKIFRPSFRFGGKFYRSVFDYKTRKVYYSVTNGGPIGLPIHQSERFGSGLNTANYTNGEYWFTVEARDWFGNIRAVRARLIIQN